MKRKGKICIAIGSLLNIFQLLSLTVLSKGNDFLKLLNDSSDTYFLYGTSASELTIREWFFGFFVGFCKNIKFISNLFVDEYAYIDKSAYEYTSAMIRDSLGAGSYHTEAALYLYDANIIIGYLLPFIIGCLLLFLGIRRWKNSTQQAEKDVDDKFDGYSDNSKNNIDDVISSEETSLATETKAIDRFEKIMREVASADHETSDSARRFLCNMARDPIKPDLRAIMWMAQEYEKNNCFGLAYEWYKKAADCNVKGASEGCERCNNPYHIDPYFNIDGSRGCGTPYQKYVNQRKDEIKKDFYNAIDALNKNPSKEQLSETFKIIYQIATAYGVDLPEAKQWIGEYFEKIKKNLVQAAKWYKEASDFGSAEGAGCYADMLANGRGVNKDVEESIKYYKMAADRGQIKAQFIIGKYYQIKGKSDLALNYLRLSADGGYAPAIEYLACKDQEKSTFDEGKIKDPDKFYADCVKAFHDKAMMSDVANRGLIFIPELIEPGKKIILEYLNDPFFQAQCKNNSQQYYYLIMSLIIESGICLATMWHESFSCLERYIEDVIENGPAEDANTIMNKYFSKDVIGDQGNKFFKEIFESWLEMHEPYWNLDDSREYTVNAMVAAYQLGVSMILEKLGY